MSTPFKPILIGFAKFANDTHFRIDQIKPKGACRITDLNTNKTSHSHSVVNAWKNVRYQAQVSHRYENTTTWPSRGYFERGQEAYTVGAINTGKGGY